ncbi:glycosyltransferase family 9 protein [Pseudomonadota bacterium AL_CKDN230030165-1A_HGKHYDSX7]
MSHSITGGFAASNPAIYVSGGIGDGVLNMVFARALAEQAGEPVTLLMTQGESALDLFRSQPYVKRVVSLQELERTRGWQRIRRLRELLRAEAFDALFLFTFRPYVALAACLAGIPRRAGFVRQHQPHFAPLFTHRAWVRRKGTPHPDTHAWLPRVLDEAGCPFEARYPSMDIPAPAGTIAADLSAALPRLVGLGLNASAPRRRYSARAYAEVARLLHARDPRLGFLLCGGADVRHIAQEIRALLPEAIPVLDTTNLATDICVSQALIARCLAFASNDSMGLHIAVAHGVPTVGLFGSSPPMHYAPCLHALAPVRGVGMDAIDPADVADAVWRRLPA